MTDNLFVPNPYSMPQKEKEASLLQRLISLTHHHRKQCIKYARLMDLFYEGITGFTKLSEIPHFTVNLFKTQKLLSIPDAEIFKVLQSSGTTSTHPSKIYLDSPTAQRQTMALANIMTSLLGPQRLPMLVIDHPHVIHDRHSYSARGAAIVGMLTFGRNVFYAMDDNMQLDRKGIKEWLEKHQNQPILLFGLTFVIWEHFLSKLLDNEFTLPEAILMHTGGWKKLQEQAVSNDNFKEKLAQLLGIQRCHNFYGMVEQIGSVFIECEKGHFHPPHFADIIIRHPKTWQECPINESGVIQVLSALPTSYPGHSLLTEDLGILLGIDDCPCGRKGKYFLVTGRVPQAEIRGCSDTYPFVSEA